MDEIRFKKGERVDLRHVPEGFHFVSIPVDDWDSVKRMNLDPRFVFKHIYSATESLSFFVLVKDSTAPSIRRLHKTDAQRDERDNKRCDTFTDLIAAAKAASKYTDEDADDNVLESILNKCIGVPHNNPEAEAIRNVMCDEICAELHRWDAKSRKFNQAHPKAIQRTNCYEKIFQELVMMESSVSEISEDLGMAKSTISTAIAKIAAWVKVEYKD